MNAHDSLRLREWLAQISVIALICVSVTAPSILISQSLPYFRIEQLLLPLVFAIYAWLLLAGIARPVGFNGMFIIGFFYCACNAVSIWYGADIIGHTVILRDFYELPKVWLPVIFFTLTYEAALSEASLRRLIPCFSLAILPVCFYAWAQFTGLSFTYRLNSLYSTGGHIDQALQYAQRVYSTMGNPNVLGELMTWSVVLFILAAVFRVGSRWWNMLVAAACLITLAMTGSRFGLLTASIGILFLFLLVSSSRRGGLARMAFLFLLIPVLAWTYQTVATSNRRTIERYQTLRNPLKIDSLRQRLDDVWQDEWRDFTQSPFVGHGPAKSFYTQGFADSEYLGVLREKGLIGMAVFLAYYLYPLVLIQRGERAARHFGGSFEEQAPATALSIHFGLILVVLALIMDLGMSTFYSPFLQGFLWMWLGVGARSAARARELIFSPAVTLDAEVLGSLPIAGKESRPAMRTY
jgi:hypothetical protein